mgnify:CR=1 FL=1
MFVLLFAAGTKLSYLVGSVLLALPFAYARDRPLAVPHESASPRSSTRGPTATTSATRSPSR